MVSSLLLSVTIVIFGYTCLWILSKKNWRNRALPPGPPALPLIGNLHQFPSKWPHYKFVEWAAEYGGIFALQMMHETIVVLNTPTAIKDVIDRKSLTTSNRPNSHIASLIIPDNENFGLSTDIGNPWKLLRKASVAMLKTENMNQYKSLQFAESSQLMFDMATNPKNFFNDISRFTTSFIMAVLYGHRTPKWFIPGGGNEAFVFTKLQLDFMYVVDLGKAPPVDLFPILKYVPKWLADFKYVGGIAKWKRDALDVRHRQEDLFGRLLDMAKRRVESGRGNGSFMEDAYINRKEWGIESDSLLRNLGGALLEASDTTSALLQMIILCLIAFPHVQKNAQEEVNRVIGSERPPTWSDLENLPYLWAVIDEVLRFRPIAPLGLPHAMAKDEIVNGMLLPKGATLFINLWAVFHDPKYFDQPEQFIPERFLKHPFGIKPDVEDDPARRENLSFGGGRRVCPGMATGKASVAINLANFLWGFNFTPAHNEKTGAIETPDIWNVSEGVNATPMPFKCTITVQSEDKRNLIAKHFLDNVEHLRPYERDFAPADRAFVEAERESLIAA